MTTSQIIAVALLYFGAFAALIYFTRAGFRRVVGTLAGGAAAALFGLTAVAIGQTLGLWRVPISPTAVFILLLSFALAISLAPAYLPTWRVARRFHGPGLAVFTVAAAVIGPPRNYMFAAKYPEWMTFAAGLTPVLGDALIYVCWIALGHAVMYLTAGSAGKDVLRQRNSSRG